jgi:hypothetical protein
MKATELISKAGGYFRKAGFQLKKHSPEILVVAGVVGTVVSAVMACKATTKVGEIVEKAKHDIDLIHDLVANEDMAEQYTKSDEKKDLVITYTQTGVKLIKLYAPAVILGVLSITGILASNNMLRKRNMALAAAYASIDKGFKEYRSRVVERFGQEVDKELRYNLKAKKIEEVIDEDGIEKKVKTNIRVADGKTLGEYSFIFDDLNPHWEKNGDFNRMFLGAQQQYANDRLRAHGYLFLNDVLKDLGFEPTQTGQFVGWLYDPDNPLKTGDGYVDFGVYETYLEDAIEEKTAVILGRTPNKETYRRAVVLEFNVDGSILSTLKNK